ncbi:transcriptional regulator [Candidatus Cytomitobacter primus]|uniref:Transcriptional regulator n=2 Tax=Candidatus Cytomitobacter primus TaxID=2066024 RepID=A0A5C0UFF5_9PROT|nr:transcriptional regulator [Candidatus Cytomitobacter primus]
MLDEESLFNNEYDSESDIIIDATIQVFASYMNNSHEPISVDQIKELLYSMKSQVKEVFRSPGKPLKPAVPVEESIHEDYLVCLEDGKKLKVLKRYLQNRYHMSLDAYKERWNLPADYPVVAPNYSKVRQKLAVDSGLGYSRKPKAKRA